MVGLEEVCAEVKNWFCTSQTWGTFKIEDGLLDVSGAEIDARNGQYIRVVGSALNDGVYTFPPENLTDEKFDGAIWVLSVPKSFLSLVSRINSWCEKNEFALDSPYQSESFGGYSYTKPSSSESFSWRDKFRTDLNRWRKI